MTAYAQLIAQCNALRAERDTLRFMLDELRAGINAQRSQRLRNERIRIQRKIQRKDNLCLDLAI